MSDATERLRKRIHPDRTISVGPGLYEEIRDVLQEFEDMKASLFATRQAVLTEGQLRIAADTRAETAELANTKLQAENDSLAANIRRLTANPADYRYWENRYRDEAAELERIRAGITKLLDRM